MVFLVLMIPHDKPAVRASRKRTAVLRRPFQFLTRRSSERDASVELKCTRTNRGRSNTWYGGWRPGSIETDFRNAARSGVIYVRKTEARMVQYVVSIDS